MAAGEPAAILRKPQPNRNTTAMKLNLRSLVVLFCAFALLALTGTGCKNTAHGAGKDIEDIGEKIQEKTD